MRSIDPLYVGVGGFVGAVLRWGVGVLVPGAPGTLVVNVLGSVALGALVAVAPSHRTRVLVGTGLLSSFTTYSTFAVETAALVPTMGLLNVGANYVLGIAAAFLGIAWGSRR
ncbi:fluoride efflux transporter FluC [Salinigranum halophilum]|uniref:fluoride efflux transporter FluC n=1 Tax=Salinigranum halophilum TaxID=2565931 RepID=UPI0010A8C1C4|nr:CrcB family protein [Salinigranum halophilum]